MARDKIIELSGEQRSDIDPRTVARVLVRLARHWQRQHQTAERPKKLPKPKVRA